MERERTEKKEAPAAGCGTALSLTGGSINHVRHRLRERADDPSTLNLGQYSVDLDMRLRFLQDIWKGKKTIFTQICQKGRMIGCMIPRCKLQREIKQPIL